MGIGLPLLYSAPDIAGTGAELQAYLDAER